MRARERRKGAAAAAQRPSAAPPAPQAPLALPNAWDQGLGKAAGPPQPAAIVGVKAFVIAESVSCSLEARRVMRKLRWAEVISPREANTFLVVCRSGLYYPLNARYDSFKELKRGAEFQMNISGSRFHVYSFTVLEDGSVMEVGHRSYAAEE